MPHVLLLWLTFSHFMSLCQKQWKPENQFCSSFLVLPPFFHNVVNPESYRSAFVAFSPQDPIDYSWWPRPIRIHATRQASSKHGSQYTVCSMNFSLRDCVMHPDSLCQPSICFTQPPNVHFRVEISNCSYYLNEILTLKMLSDFLCRHDICRFYRLRSTTVFIYRPTIIR